jgi:hypothetical protein
MPTDHLAPAAIAVCVDCRVRPRAASGLLSRCMSCFRAHTDRDAAEREARHAQHKSKTATKARNRR